MYYIYMLRCKDNSIYTGITVDIERRFNEHLTKDKKCAKYTFNHEVQKIECIWKTENKSFASKLEYYIKKLPKKDKEEIILKNNLEEKFGEKLDCAKYERYNLT